MKLVFRTMAFCSVIACVILLLNQVTLNRRSEGCIQLADFYRLEDDQVDVLCIGSSHVYYGINTCLLYDDYGIASYLLASPGQPVWLSYYLLEEALKTQEPELVVLDYGTLFRKEEDFGSSSWETVISMKPSLTKWKLIQAVNQYGEYLDPIGAFFSFPYYHTRFLTLTSEDFQNTQRVRYNGYKPEFTTIAESELKKWEKAMSAQDEESASGKTGALTERAEDYLRKFIELCQKQGISLLLVNSPFANQSAEKQEASQDIRAIAEVYDVPLIEGNRCKEEMQIDLAEDLLDASHLNYYGSVKYTSYLAKWMMEHCSLTDRRGDEDYRGWEETSELFRQLEMGKI